MKKTIIYSLITSLLLLGCSPQIPDILVSEDSFAEQQVANNSLPEEFPSEVKQVELVEQSFQPDPEAFVISFVVDPFSLTANINVTDYETSTKNIYPDYSLDCDGDGIFEQKNLRSSTKCIYTTPGRHRMQLKGFVPLLTLRDISKNVIIEQWGKIPWYTMSSFGALCEYLTIIAKDAPDLSRVRNMSDMFIGSGFNSPIEHWDVSNVEDMNRMFSHAKKFNQPLNGWNVSNVTDMSRMFSHAINFNQPLNEWNVSNVTDMSRMFYYAESFDQPLNSWDVSNVKRMNGMFCDASSFNSPIDNWNVSNVTSFAYMFTDATLFNQPVGNWKPQKADMESMFSGAKSFNQDLSQWDFNDKSLGGFFLYASSYNHRATLKKIEKGCEDGSIKGIDSYDELFNMFDLTSAFTSIEPIEQPIRATFPLPPKIVQDSHAVHKDFGPFICVIPDAPNPIPVESMRPLILTFETYKSNTYVDIWVDNKIIVASRKIPTLFGNPISYWSEPIRKKYPTHIEVDCDGDNIYENIYKDVPSDHRFMCFFDKKGKHQIKIRGEVPHLKAAYNFYGSVAIPYALISVDQWGDIRWKSMHEFLGDSSLTRKVSINAKDAPDLRDVCDMSDMFIGVPVFNASIENWNTSHVETMFGLFTGSTGLNQDLSRWDISSLRDAKMIFGSCYSKIICPKCDAFRVKLFNESMYRPSTFDLQLCDDLFRDEQKLKCIKGPWCSTRDKDNYKYK